MQFYELTNLYKITPNQFYLLYSLREGVQTAYINIHAELRILIASELVMNDHNITQKGHDLISEVESYFKIQKKKTSTTIMGDGFIENLAKYNLLFPKIKLPSGKLARASETNLETNFKWFFEKHKYSWDTIFKATAAYVDEYERKSWNYMRTSMYFIKKQESDKSITSDLADHCAMIESGGTIEEPNYFKVKVI